MKKSLFFLLVLNSVFTFAQFGSKVKFSPENKIKYETLTTQLNSELKILNNKIRLQKENIKNQNGTTNYIDYTPIKDSLCNSYLNKVEKLVPPDQVKYFWKVVNRRMNKSQK